MFQLPVPGRSPFYLNEDSWCSCRFPEVYCGLRYAAGHALLHGAGNVLHSEAGQEATYGRGRGFFTGDSSA